MKKTYISLLFSFIICTPSYAYLDPGTGSMLLSALVAVFASLFFAIKTIYYKCSSLILRLLGVKIDKTKHELIFYSEGPNYWSTFKPTVTALLELDQKIVFLTSSEKDPALNLQHPLFTAKYIGTGNKAFIYLSFIEANACVLTTPGLDVLQLKRSKGVKNYIHLLHALGSTSFYKLFSFDYYDTILCSGQYQKNELRLLEERRSTPGKTLLNAGCPYIDSLFERKRNYIETMHSITPVILIAPSWGKNNLLKHLPIHILKEILEMNINIIIRPHPQSLISEIEFINDLQIKLKNYTNLEWDLSIDNFPSLSKSYLLISDFSSITFDFALVFERPIITFKTDQNFDGIEHFDLQDQPIWEDTIIEKMGLRLRLEDLPNLQTYILETLQNEMYIKNIQEIKKTEFYNLGKSKNIIAEQIKKIVQEEASNVK